jgi:phosphoribosylaminoimidazole-succinocarboxamide synthase
MSLEHLALAKTNDFSLKHEGDVHSGKVRSVYWLTKKDSKRIIEQKQYTISPESLLGVMIISDKISAFECNWQGEDGLQGVPGKGASLNAVSKYWFKKFDEAGLAGNHVLDSPHPLVWIVQKAKPIMIEAIARQYITGSMWRAYEKGKREFCGIILPEDLKKNQKLGKLLITPSTKGILKGISGVPEDDDVNITRQQILDNFQAFGFKSPEGVPQYEKFLIEGFKVASSELQGKGLILVDEKKEFGYVKDVRGNSKMIYIDEPPTPDSARIWNAESYKKGEIIEKSKEGFRKFLLEESGLDKEILLNKERMSERKKLATEYRVPVKEMMKVSQTYKDIVETITGSPIPEIKDARGEILDALSGYKIVV